MLWISWHIGYLIICHMMIIEEGGKDSAAGSPSDPSTLTVYKNGHYLNQGIDRGSEKVKCV